MTALPLPAQTRDDGYLQTNLVANKAGISSPDHRRTDDQRLGHRLAAAGRGRPYLDLQRRHRNLLRIHRRCAGQSAPSGRTEDRHTRPTRFHRPRLRLRHRPGLQFRQRSPRSAGRIPVSGPADNLKASPAEPIKDGYSGSAKFVFVTEDGCINAWSANTAVAMSAAPVIINYSKTASSFPVHGQLRLHRRGPDQQRLQLGGLRQGRRQSPLRHRLPQQRHPRL